MRLRWTVPAADDLEGIKNYLDSNYPHLSEPTVPAICAKTAFCLREYDEAMGARTLLTFEDFEKYQDDGKKHELLKGEHITLPPPKFDHSRIQHNLLDALRPYVRQHQLGDAMMETGFRLSADTWLQPDVSFVRSAQIKKVAPYGYLEGSPALAIEVASESNTAAQLDLKLELYFAHGAEEVWIVYPQTRHVRVHFPDGRSETLAGDLRSSLFPGWSALLDTVFAA